MNISNSYQNYLWMGLTMGVISVSILILMSKAAGAF